jgi:hypothetical protein
LCGERVDKRYQEVRYTEYMMQRIATGTYKAKEGDGNEGKVVI